MADQRLRIAVLGLGEAGSAFAADLAAAGATVLGYDPRAGISTTVRRAATAAAAAGGADLVLSLNSCGGGERRRRGHAGDADRSGLRRPQHRHRS